MIVTLANFRPTLVASCFDILVDCVKVVDHEVAIVPGLEQLATRSATCCLRTLSYLSAIDPTPGVLGYVRERYNSIFPPEPDFKGFPFYHVLGAIHRLLHSDQERWQRARIEWRDYKPPGHEHVIVAQALTKFAQSEYRRSERLKVPRWILRFALHSLSLGTVPPTSVVTDCLSIIAVDLGCHLPNRGNIVLDERYIYTWQILILLTSNQCTAGAGFDPDYTKAHNNG